MKYIGLLFLTSCATIPDTDTFDNGCRSGLVFAYSKEMEQTSSVFPSMTYIEEMCKNAKEFYNGENKTSESK